MRPVSDQPVLSPDSDAGASHGPPPPAPGASRQDAGSSIAIAPIRASAVLPTLNDDGSRRWLHPKLSKGRFLAARRVTAYLLIAVFALLPLARLNGRPLILLDITSRKFHILGATFYPTDTLLVALLLVMAFLGVFWFTAVLGRVWCGWACPQTVYMEFLFRPLERLLEGAPGRPGLIRSKHASKIIKWAAYVACALVLSHIFLAYFVSWEQLGSWMIGSPAAHPLGFGVVVIVAALILLDFGLLREQICLIMCPYGRFQSVMLDRHSLIVRYDRKRGEPRGKKKRDAALALPVLSDSAPASGSLGDCIDCSMCVTTCPTGIDIRNGLQMECIGCAQCIDACNTVMDKIGRPRGLIRYSSQAAVEGQRFRLLRPRVVLYPAIIVVLGVLFTTALLRTRVADVTVLRGLGQPFTMLPNGEVRNAIRVRVANRTDKAAEFSLSAGGLEGVVLTSETPTTIIPPGETVTIAAEVDAPGAALRDARASVFVIISGPGGFAAKRPFTLVGPSHPAEKGAP